MIFVLNYILEENDMKKSKKQIKIILRAKIKY